MFFAVSDLDQARSYKLMSSCIVPRPIAWVVTKNRDEGLNAAPYSLFNFFGGHPPVVCIGMGRPDGKDKDSLENIRNRKEFVVNMVPEGLAEAMNMTATPYDYGIRELDIAGLSTLPCQFIDCRRILASPVALECKLAQIVDIRPSSAMVMATVVGIHVDAAAVVNEERCYVDAARLGLIGRMESPGWYARTHERFRMTQVMKKPVPDDAEAGGA